MISFSSVGATTGWFQESGPDYDVVLSSRVRLSRNLAGRSFPQVLQSSEEEEVQSEVVAAFASLGLSTARIGEVPQLERRMMLERHFISRDFTLQTEKACMLGPEGRVSAMVNEIDHVRLSVLRGGRDLEGCRVEADSIDSQLESDLEFAVSLEWGYLSARVLNCGTGMRCSVMLHLPALVETGLIEKALKAIVQVGMNVKGFFADDEGSLGQMYQISNQFTFGFTETDFIEKLNAITHQLIHYERKARGDLLENSAVDIEDRVLRALGLLRYCKKLSVREVIQYLSSVRLGVALGIVQAPLERVTALLFLSQKAHVQYFVQDEEESADADILDHARARIVQDSLIRDDVNWEDLHV